MDKKQYFIAAVNKIRNIRVFDMNGKNIKEFQKSERYGNYFESYLDKKTSKNYFLTVVQDFWNLMITIKVNYLINMIKIWKMIIIPIIILLFMIMGSK